MHIYCLQPVIRVPVISWRDLPVCCSHVSPVLLSRTVSVQSTYSLDTPWRDNLDNRKKNYSTSCWGFLYTHDVSHKYIESNRSNPFFDMLCFWVNKRAALPNTSMSFYSRKPNKCMISFWGKQNSSVKTNSNTLPQTSFLAKWQLNKPNRVEVYLLMEQRTCIIERAVQNVRKTFREPPNCVYSKKIFGINSNINGKVWFKKKI